MANSINNLIANLEAAIEDRKTPLCNEKSLKGFLNESKPRPKRSEVKEQTGTEPVWIDVYRNSSLSSGKLESRKSGDQHAFIGALSSDDRDAFVNSLRICARTKDLVRGASIHRELVQSGLLEKCSDALVTMYVKCGELEKAESLLYLHKSKLAFAWTAVIAGYTHQGRGQSALDCFKQMQHEGILPNSVTYKCALKACALIKSTDIGRDIHKKVSSRGLLQEDPGLGNALVNMYVKCRAISDAQKVLEELSARDVVSWNILISGYIQEDEVEQALDCVEQMQHEGILPDLVTYVSALKACAKIRAIEMGRHFHQEITMQGLLQNNIELGGALVNMYAKCGKISEAQHVLEELPFRDVISWSALIAGYVEEGQAEQALKCSDQMQHEGIVPDAVTFVYMLRACAILRETKRGRRIHVEIVRQGLLQNDIILGNALVDMYAKCGEVSVARCILEELPFRDVVSWNTLIAGYVQEGELEHALNCFEWMQIDGILPDAVTCACVLNVCSQQGLIQEGQTLFMNMITKYGVKPSLESYTCMIALFGHAGHLEKAVRLVQEVSAAGSTTLWHALMGSCQKSTDVNVAEWVFEQAESLDKSDESAYVLLGNIYAAASLEGQVKRLEGMRIRNCY